MDDVATADQREGFRKGLPGGPAALHGYDAFGHTVFRHHASRSVIGTLPVAV